MFGILNTVKVSTTEENGMIKSLRTTTVIDQIMATHKNISLWKSSSTLTSGFFPSTFERMSLAGRLVMSNRSTQGRSLQKSARHCLIASCITTYTMSIKRQISKTFSVCNTCIIWTNVMIDHRTFCVFTHHIINKLVGFIHKDVHPWFQ